jgi:hypothetical protein
MSVAQSSFLFSLCTELRTIVDELDAIGPGLGLLNGRSGSGWGSVGDEDNRVGKLNYARQVRRLF